MGKIGLGIITCNREKFYTKCYSSIPQNKIDSLITVNDGKQYDKPPPAGHIFIMSKIKELVYLKT